MPICQVPQYCNEKGPFFPEYFQNVFQPTKVYSISFTIFRGDMRVANEANCEGVAGGGAGRELSSLRAMSLSRS